MTDSRSSEGPVPSVADIRQVAARWLTERDAGALSRTDLAEMERWLEADGQHRAVFDRLERVWAQMGTVGVEGALERRQRHRLSPFARWSGAAMAACLALGVAGAASDLPTRLEADYMSAAGELRQVQLEDGSVVHLNSRSAVAVDYSAASRGVRLLKGEAAFTVAKDAARPFVVTGGNGTTTALGTEFIVRHEGKRHQVFVTEHSVRVDSGGAQAIVGEGQAADYGAQGVSGPYALAVSDASAWMRGRLVFADQPLSEVVRELNRYHKGRILITDAGLSQQRFSGSFRTKDTQAAVAAIEDVLKIQATRLPGGLVLLHP